MGLVIIIPFLKMTAAFTCMLKDNLDCCIQSLQLTNHCMLLQCYLQTNTLTIVMFCAYLRCILKVIDGSNNCVAVLFFWDKQVDTPKWLELTVNSFYLPDPFFAGCTLLRTFRSGSSSDLLLFSLSELLVKRIWYCVSESACLSVCKHTCGLYQ